MQIVYALFLGTWRRWFGGGVDFLPYNRFFQHIIGFTACSLFLWYSGYNFVQIVLASAVLQGLFWARSHGCCFDFGHGTVDVKRYDQLWYWKYIKKQIPEKLWYTFYCDFFLFFVRYTLPALLIGVILMCPLCTLMGLAISGSYALCWIAYDFGWTKRPTEISEYIGGFVCGLLL